MLAVVDTDAAGRGAGGARPARRRGEAGFSLIEILVVLTIVSVVSAGTIIGFRSLIKSELRSQASKLAAAIRYSYDRAISTGSYYRLHINFEENSYRLEKADARVLLNTTERASRNGRGEDRDVEDRRAQEEDLKGQPSGVSGELLPPPSPRRPKFAAYVDSQLKPVRLSRARILDVLTPRQSEAYRTGHAYLHFFPDGHTERALIHIGPESDNPADDDQFSLLVHALTGRVEVLPGRAPTPRDFSLGTGDDGVGKGGR